MCRFQSYLSGIESLLGTTCFEVQKSSNRTLVELKAVYHCQTHTEATGSNRTLVELKVIIGFHVANRSAGSNRTLVELKDFKAQINALWEGVPIVP